MNLCKYINNYNYLRLSIAIWRVNGLSRINNLESSAANTVSNIIRENEDYIHVLDGSFVLESTDGAMTPIIKEIIDLGVETHFLNVDPIQTHIHNLYNEYSNDDSCYSQFDGRIIIHRNEYQLRRPTLELIKEANQEIDNYISDHTSKSFLQYGDNEYRELKSTPILATGEFDASKLISDPNIFTWICIRLCDLVFNKLEKKSSSNFEILSVNLRSSPFANAVSLLLDISLRTIDHLGPNHKIWDFDSFFDYAKPNTKYILITDFIVGGTELKLASLFAKYNYSEVVSAISIGTLLELNRYSGFDVDRIISMKGLNPKANYKLFDE